MTHSNRITLRIFLPTRQLSKLVDCWVNLNGERARGPQGCRQCQKTSVWVLVSKRAMVARSEGRRERAIMAERTRIAAREDRYPRGLIPARIAALFSWEYGIYKNLPSSGGRNVLAVLYRMLTMQIKHFPSGADPEIEEGGGGHTDWGLV